MLNFKRVNAHLVDSQFDSNEMLSIILKNCSFYLKGVVIGSICEVKCVMFSFVSFSKRDFTLTFLPAVDSILHYKIDRECCLFHFVLSAEKLS